MTRRRAAAARLALGAGVLVVTAIAARRPGPHEVETSCFDAINGLPDTLLPPLWPVMQLGALAAVPVVAGAVWWRGDPSSAKRLLVSGTATWVLAKGVKRLVGRGRPAAVFEQVRVRGDAQSGAGFLSGHAAIATALAAGVMPGWSGAAPLLAGLAGTVGFARIYVGAHLPLDVVGGAALGVMVNAALDLAAPTR